MQQYWLSVDGRPSLYGVVFSSYSIGQFIFIPLVAEFLDRFRMRPLLLLSVTINIIGNLIYMGAASVSGDGGQVIKEKRERRGETA